MDREDHLQAVQLFSETCEKEFKDDVWAVLVIGSVARNEHVIGKSDIDMACVLKKDIIDVHS